MQVSRLGPRNAVHIRPVRGDRAYTARLHMQDRVGLQRGDHERIPRPAQPPLAASAAPIQLPGAKKGRLAGHASPLVVGIFVNPTGVTG